MTRGVSRVRKLCGFLPLVVIAGSFAVLAPVAAAQPCWQAVISDWADNERVDGRYKIDCYRDALRNLPEDLRAYSSAPDDIERAMREEMRRLQEQAGGEESSGAPVTTSGGGSSGSPQPGSEPTKQEAPLPYFGDPGKPAAESDGVLVQALDEIGPNDAKSFPLPLIALGGLFGLLLIAGGVGFLARRNRGSPAGRAGVSGPR